MEANGEVWSMSLGNHETRAAFEKLIYAARYRFYKCDSALYSRSSIHSLDKFFRVLFQHFFFKNFGNLRIWPRRSTIFSTILGIAHASIRLEKFCVSENFNFERKEGSGK